MKKRFLTLLMTLVFMCGIQTTLAATNPIKLLFPSNYLTVVTTAASAASLPPVATGASYTIYRSVTGNETRVAETLQASDPQGYTLKYNIVKKPSMGTLTSFNATTGSFVYTPTKNRIGQDYFEFNVTATNTTNTTPTSLTSPTRRITISIIPNIAPFHYRDLANHWVKFSAEQLIHKAVIGESVDGRYYFDPNRVMTRSEFLLLLNSVMDVPDGATQTSMFADVTMQHLYGPLNGAYTKGVTSGIVENGVVKFRPDAKITRIEAMMMLSNALKLPAGTSAQLSFTDKNTVPAWAVRAVANMVDYGIINGNGGMLRPHDILTRAEAASMLYKAYEQNVILLNP